MPAVFYILFGALFTTTVCLAAGRILLRSTGATLDRYEEDALGFVIGAGAVSLLVFVIAALHIAQKGVYLAVGLAIIAAAVRLGAHHNVVPAFPPLPRFWRWFLVALFSAFTVVYFFNAMAPEFSPDGASYHLGVVSRYARAHSLLRFPMNMYGSLSQGIEMLYLMAYTFGRHSSAALVHYAFLLSLTFSVLSFGRRVGKPLAGLGGAMLVYIAPIIGIDGTTAYVDVAVAAIVFAVFYLVQIWDADRRTPLLPVIGLTAGFAYAAKYSAFIAVIYAVGYVLWRARQIRPAAIVALCSLALAIPWAARDALWYGNPFAPMLNAWFPNVLMHVSREQEWTAWLRSYDLASRWSIPLDLTVRGGLNGIFGPVFLLLPFALLTLRTSVCRRVLFAGALFSIPYAANIGARFLIPALPFFAFALAYVIAARPAALGAVVAFHAVASWPACVRLYAPYVWRLPDRIPFKQALRIEQEDTWLSHNTSYLVARLIEQAVPPGQHVYSTQGVPEAYTSRDIWVNWQSARGDVLDDIFFASTGGDNQPRFAVQFTFPATRVSKVRVVATGTAPADQQWSVSEFRVYTGGQELARAPGWRLRANPNPWDVQLAFDNSPVTRWRTWQPYESGMYIELGFTAPHTVDRVHLECASESTHTPLRLDGLDASGAWRTLTASASTTEIAPVRFMALAAIREMKVRGVDYLLIRDSDWNARDILEDPKAWGLTPVGCVSDVRLYRLDPGPPVLEPDATAPEEQQRHGPLLTRR